MIKNNQRHINKLHILLDVFIIAAAYASAWGIKYLIDSYNNVVGGVAPTPMYLYTLCAVVPGYLILYGIFNMYTSKRTRDIKGQIMDVFNANTVGILIFFFVLFIIHMTNFSRIVLFLFYALNILYKVLSVILIRSCLNSIRKKGYNRKHIILVGYSRAAEGYIDRILMNPSWGYNVVGIIDDEVSKDTVYHKVPIIGRVDELQELIAANDLDEIVITLGLKDYHMLEKIVAICEKSGVHTKFIPDYNHIIPTRPFIEDVQGLPVINIRRVPLSVLYNRFFKRSVDLIFGLLALILFSPIMLVVAIGVRISSKGSVVYKQTRVGLHNRTFEMYKFRSMVEQTDGTDKTQWTTSDDPRVTKFGKFIRKMSLDELPQLINVLKGDMSLVGPRPERPYYVDKFKEEIPRYMIKHQVRPGMTGWAQVNGYRGDTSIEKRIEYDLYYIENWNMLFDIKILFKTLFRGFFNKNAY